LESPKGRSPVFGVIATFLIARGKTFYNTTGFAPRDQGSFRKHQQASKG
jgi:hypothetical protein